MNYTSLPSAHLSEHRGHKVLDSRVIVENGAFRKVIIWLPGHVNVPHARYITGYTGKETEVITDFITPTRVFDWAGLWTIKEAA